MRRDLPTGTVTFLFTDVEGSTRLLHGLGAEAYAEALAEHRHLIREACAAHDGVEVDTQGDAFFFAFPTAPGALAAAAAFTEALAAGPILVRVGIHTGTPFLAEEGYVGEDVHRAARIAATGHGGQVLVSASTGALAGSDGQRDLGEHRLKDLSAPERIYQLGDGSFPPLATLYRTNLPVPATPFLGRQRELAEVVALLGRDDLRLLTLTGPGGTGKTRLALQAAAEASESYPDGVYWVPLAPLREPTLLLSALAQVLAVKEEPDRELQDTLDAFLAGKRLLLVLDNAEHLLPDIAGPIAALRDANGSRVLVTSRERLRIGGEQTWPVPPLEHSDGTALFVVRARAVDPAFTPTPAVGELCSRLDELPLAIELAAARTAVFSSEQLLERLSGRLDLLKGERDADPRQQTLRATIAWSYDLLTEIEQGLFRRLAVFLGGCTYDAAEEVADADPDTLQSLLDKSLLRKRDAAGEPRYWMLETIREYATERIEQSEERDLLRDRHLEYVATQTFQRRRLVRDYDPDARAYLRSEHENVREALGWAVESDRTEPAQQIVIGAWFYWITGGHASEGAAWASRVAALATKPSEATANVLSIAAEFPRFRGDPEQARSLQERAIAILELLDTQDPVVAARLTTIHSDLSDVLGQLGDLDRALEHVELAVSIARDLGDPPGIGHALEAAAHVAERRNDPLEAQALYEESVATYEGAGKPLEATFPLIGLSSARLTLGDLVGARSAVEGAAHRAAAAGDEVVMFHAVAMRGLVARAEGDLQRAVRLLAQAQTTAKAGGFAIEVGARDLEVDLAECRATLGEKAFEQAYRAGAAKSVSRSALGTSA